MLLLAGGLWAASRRRRPVEPDEAEFDHEEFAATEPEIEAEPAAVHLPAPAPAPAPLPQPAFSAPLEPLSIAFEAKRLSATLMNATLDYRIELANESDRTVELIALAADMIGAHASLGAEQLAQNTAELEVLHRVPRLAAGERKELTGSIRLPLAQIVPIRQGQAAIFVPLVRVRLSASPNGGDPFEAPRTFVIGEPPLASGGGLRPFRLDLGPRIYADVAARKVEIPA